MKKLLFVLLVGTILACGQDKNEDTTPPRKPVFVYKSLDSAKVETGIDAIPETDGIRFEWFLNTENDLDVYTIYRRKDSVNTTFSELTSIEADSKDFLDSLLVTQGEDSGLIRQYLFFVDDSINIAQSFDYYIRAFDKSGNPSSPSDTVSYRIEPKPTILEPKKQTNSQTPSLKWNWNPLSFPQFLVRVRDEFGKTIWIYQNIPDAFPEDYEVVFNEDGKASIPLLEQDGKYSWRIDGIGSYNEPFSGAESAWEEFIVDTTQTVSQ
ncbi:MAG: hypothetical protein DWQ06_06825 [Calditrichaeota bacterium]|nr:MAG: hypothetical protein DWQ06_06825 [Calditrichota bacterium]